MIDSKKFKIGYVVAWENERIEEICYCEGLGDDRYILAFDGECVFSVLRSELYDTPPSKGMLQKYKLVSLKCSMEELTEQLEDYERDEQKALERLKECSQIKRKAEKKLSEIMSKIKELESEAEGKEGGLKQ